MDHKHHARARLARQRLDVNVHTQCLRPGPIDREPLGLARGKCGRDGFVERVITNDLQ